MAPKKDVTSCEKPRGVANEHRSVDIRMRELTASNVAVSLYEQDSIAKGTRGTETSNYPEEKKVRTIPRVVASEIGGAQTRYRDIRRVGIGDK